jgi:hypothetical protein
MFVRCPVRRIRKEQSLETVIASCAGLDVHLGSHLRWLDVQSSLAKMAKRKFGLRQKVQGAGYDTRRSTRWDWHIYQLL